MHNMINKKKGTYVFIKSYNDRNRYENEEIVIDDICWESGLLNLIEFIKKSGIKKFYIADTSTALMGTLHAFILNGFTISDAKLLKQRYYMHEKFDDDCDEIRALEIIVN